MDVWLSFGAPSKLDNVSSFSRAMHVYVLGRHVHCIDHSGLVMSWGLVGLVAGIYLGIGACVFVGLECVGFLVYCFIVLAYVTAYHL